jgi:hypothetical protein
MHHWKEAPISFARSGGQREGGVTGRCITCSECFKLQVEQLAMEQQLAGREFAVTDVIKHRGKRARLERISQVGPHCRKHS